jgi:hypothetical protein
MPDTLESAWKRLSEGKAIGTDGLQDRWFKDKTSWNKCKFKILKNFKAIIASKDVPRYFKRTMVMNLSKENTDTPEVGGVRTIAIASAIAKLFELPVLEELEKDQQIKQPLNKEQRGFVKTKSSYDNLLDITN